MKSYKGYIFSFITMLVFMGVGSACTHEEIDRPENGMENYQHFLVFHVRSLETTPFSTSNEMIRSLRIIMLSDGAIEKNEYISFGPGGQSIAGFNYAFLWETEPGRKDFYLFANEESVKDISFQESPSVPDDLNNVSSLSDFLSYFSPDESSEAPDESGKNSNSGVNLDKGTLLKQLIPSLIFSPVYTSILGSVFLPYSASYTGEFGKTLSQEGGGVYFDNPLYLVPVATKFTFSFVNLTKDDLKINDLTISNINISNYLFANVGDEDYKKDFAPLNDKTYVTPESDKNLYWVYWLAKVAKASQENSAYFDNVNFNDTYGWISHYDMPESDLTPYNFIGNLPEASLTLPPASEDGEEEFTTTTEVFYVPESKNTVTTDSQAYRFRLGVNKAGENRHIDLDFYNLKALFRNTSVKVTISISDTDLKIYAEVSPWSPKVANGWLLEEK